MNEPQVEPYVRSDIAQAFNNTRKLRARTNIRAARQPEINEALVYGLTGSIGASYDYEYVLPTMDDPLLFTITAVGGSLDVTSITTPDLVTIYPEPPTVIADASGQLFSILVPIGTGITLQITTNLGILDVWIPPGVGGSTVTGSSGTGGPITIYLTPLGNWSSDGNDTAPGSGVWYFFERISATQTYDATDDDQGDLASTTSTFVHFDVTLWVDGTQDTSLAWHSEVIEQSLATDLFAFRAWYPDPDLENPEWEDEAVQTQVTIVIEPVEKPLLQVNGSTPITDTAMTDLGFDTQIEVTDGDTVWFVPAAGSAWA